MSVNPKGPDVSPLTNPQPDPNSTLTLQEVVCLKQFLEKGIRTDNFFFDSEKKVAIFIQKKLENIITETMKLINEDNKK